MIFSNTEKYSNELLKTFIIKLKSILDYGLYLLY